MSGEIFDDGIHVTYGPYSDGDKPEFTQDPVNATVSFDVFDDKISDAKLWHPNFNKVACYIDNPDGGINCGVVTSDGKVADHIENLYFTFDVETDDVIDISVDDDVNHPKHYTGHKADVECIMFTELLPSLAANAFKYVWRCDDKGNRDKDLEKARWYLQRICDSGFYEKRAGWKVRSLMLGIIDASDFDDWHKTVLANIVRGCYSTACDNISCQLGDCDDISSQLEEPDFF